MMRSIRFDISGLAVLLFAASCYDPVFAMPQDKRNYMLTSNATITPSPTPTSIPTSDLHTSPSPSPSPGISTEPASMHTEIPLPTLDRPNPPPTSSPELEPDPPSPVIEPTSTKIPIAQPMPHLESLQTAITGTLFIIHTERPVPTLDGPKPPANTEGVGGGSGGDIPPTAGNVPAHSQTEEGPSPTRWKWFRQRNQYRSNGWRRLQSDYQSGSPD
ncbi:hypothetical protein P152DRAFT_172133 [Eremomyces bilateralis CBS 781.70]|uniref:Uncharacterized protein n=1 Tax=Eremomyces bilateralis CBS 781.70 TaxID=1392243 RepID=A0A6G1FTR2_9PEZI|nr:uncharacterized protein P152DRAFT_172133 [Eremomyces bilateralis CBS 781.70]KAF1809187.1 hypothetical protein P152DRAFT_172133 [Eremomyces bilateralis CBS 781.70]